MKYEAGVGLPKASVTLNGRMINWVVRADEEVGKVTFAPTAADGKPIFQTDDYLLCTAHGRVRIHMERIPQSVWDQASDGACRVSPPAPK